MSKKFPILLLAASVLLPVLSFGQVEIQLRVGRRPGWDPRQREGQCQIRVWVDNRAEVRMRGDRIWVNTREGGRGRDEGSECSQALPYNSVRDFRINQVSGRSRIRLAQEPNRNNNYTAMIEIEDRQGGGDSYAFDVTWRADEGAGNAPAPFFDEVRACQDVVRQQFLKKNGRGAYIDFDGFADRPNQGQGGNWRRNTRRGQERIQGRGSANNASQTREITYSCVVDVPQGRVQSAEYRYLGGDIRFNERYPLR